MLLRHRIQEWLADRVTWVQYPDIRAAQRQGFRFTHDMPPEKRIGIALIAGFTLIGALIAFGIAVFVLWLLLSTLI